MAPRETASQFDLRRLTADLEAYRQGSLLYMYLENFVTYDEVEIYPGPYMNMVMGPNGTGKSSIVAAMAIGLGWSPSVLGRSKEVSEFIKYNTDRAVIEMVLRLEPEITTITRMNEEGDESSGRGTFDWSSLGLEYAPETGYCVIRRELVRGAVSSTDEPRPNGRSGRPTYSSEWRVNGKEVRYKAVQELVRWLNIQCDNLCQFLPQDRVSEFARMTSVELLMETEKAAASQEVVQAHLSLIEGRKAMRIEHISLEAGEKALESLEQQESSLEVALERHRNYEEHLKMISLCEKKRPWLEYNDARESYLVKRDLRDKAKQTLDAALVDVDPLRRREKELVVITSAFNKSRQVAQTKLEKKRRAVDEITGHVRSHITDTIKEKREEFFSVRKRREKQKNLMNAVRTEIKDLEKVVTQDIASARRQDSESREKLSEINRSLAKFDSEYHTFDGQLRSIQNEANDLNGNFEVTENELAAFDDIRQRRLQVLHKRNVMVAKAYEWLQKHRGEFSSIQGPICMDLNAKNPAMAKTVENGIGLSVLLSFVSNNDDEAERFLERLFRECDLRVNMIVVDERAASALIRNLPPIHPELKAAGFEGMVLDYIEAPELIKLALLDSAKIHMVPVATQAIKKSIDSVSQQALHNIRKLLAPDLKYEINTSRYSSDRVIRSSDLRWAEFLNNSVDEQRKELVRQRLEQIREAQKAVEGRIRAVLEKREASKPALNKLNAEKSAIEMERRQALETIKAHEIATKKLQIQKGKLRDMAESLAEMKEEPIRAQLIELFNERRSSVLKAAKALFEYKEVLSGIIEGQLEDSLNTSELFRIRARISEMESKQAALKDALLLAEREFIASKDRAKALLEKANRNPIDEDLKNQFADLPETLAELDLRIAQETAKASMIQGASGAGAQAVSDLKRIKADIASQQAMVSRLRSSMESRQAEMKKLHDQWYPNIIAMVKRINVNFNNFFNQLGCLGEVRLEEHGDAYDEWEIAILVRFRDEETLQRLSAQRQSGGEKSVSTILYLLALQELSKSPFRVVDEINQGMDATNERKVHSLIVDTATSAQNKSQYFLITPKLLTNLTYHENMHVLCVYNGEGMPIPAVWRDTARRRGSVVAAH